MNAECTGSYQSVNVVVGQGVFVLSQMPALNKKEDKSIDVATICPMYVSESTSTGSASSTDL